MEIPQLKVKTEFSFRNAFGPISRVAAALAEIGCPAAGIVDGGTWGHVRWAQALEKVGVRPLFGTELSIAAGDGRRPTAWALAEDTKAFYRFSTAARREGADITALFRDTKGIIRFAGAALTDPDTFDYIDLSPASPLQQMAALRLAESTGKPLVLVSDNAYPLKRDYAAFMAIVAREKVTPQHLLTREEFRAAFPILGDEEFARAAKNTFEAAERAASALAVAPLIRFDGDLRALAEAGKARRLSLGHLAAWTPEHEARLQRELDLIHLKGFESYFLVVADLVVWAKQRMLVGPGRGSSAGSLLCYLIGITEVDPLVHNLLFERFVDLTRKDLPDIDIDFSDRKRDECFTYLAEKYGRANVARIGNISTLKPRSVMAEVGKRFAIPIHETFALRNVLIEYSSGDSRFGKGLEDTFIKTDIGQKFVKKNPSAVIMTEVENHAWHTSVHAAGVIVSNEAVSDYCTVGADGVAQLDKPDAEYLNLLKIDALGLSTLGVIEDSGVVTSDELYALKLNDPEVFKIFNEHKFSSIFQFEGRAQRSVAEGIEVRSFKEIDHITALARPGPLGGGAANKYVERHEGLAPVEVTHPVMAEMLADTFGVVLYQEQVMRIVREIGKFSWEETTIIRKAMSGRKGKEYFDRQGEHFIQGAAQDGISEDDAKAIWNEICNFGAWGMNACLIGKAHVKLAHPNQFDATDGITIEELYRRYKLEPTSWIRQRKVMPILLSVGADGIARPTMAKDIHKNGVKPCIRLSFRDGEFIECTRDHRFIINGKWRRCGSAKIGDEFKLMTRDHSSTNHGHDLNKRNACAIEFKFRKRNDRCDDCCCQVNARMEAHHNDFVGGKERPDDLAWLCNSCHKKRHIEHGSRRAPYSRGYKEGPPAILMNIEDIGEHETYDIEMPAPNHNFLLANGIVTHNSHTCSYAIISYWCAWMKRYHPLEYAAACLRHPKDDDDVIAVLREMAKEGVKYIPFDIERSDVNWTVVDGQLLGGFMNLVGFGPAKAVAAVEARRLGTMTDAMREKILAAPVKYTELYPLQREYADWYASPEAHGCAPGSVIMTADQFPEEGGPVLFLGKVTKKQQRSEHEAMRVSKRNGKPLRGPATFADVQVKDDTGLPTILRIDRYDYETLQGDKILSELRVDEDVVLVRGYKLPRFPMVKVERMKCLTRPEAFNVKTTHTWTRGRAKN